MGHPLWATAWLQQPQPPGVWMGNAHALIDCRVLQTSISSYRACVFGYGGWQLHLGKAWMQRVQLLGFSGQKRSPS